MAVQPISPQEAMDTKISMIPDEVIIVVNRMLTLRATKSMHIVLMQNVIVQEVLAEFKANGTTITKNQVYASHWLDFEPFYEKAGWKVVYDKPAYCESYEANFTFSKA